MRSFALLAAAMATIVFTASAKETGVTFYADEIYQGASYTVPSTEKCYTLPPELYKKASSVKFEIIHAFYMFCNFYSGVTCSYAEQIKDHHGASSPYLKYQKLNDAIGSVECDFDDEPE